MLKPGSRLGSYEVLAPLGAGGMGQVFRARDSRLGRDVALKVLPEDFAADSERRARFEREAQILASLNHPNIATLYGIEESTGTQALVLELVEGDTLADRLAGRRGGLPIPEALEIARQIAAALEAAHEHGVIHRDLKPSNIALKADGTVKVLDFGLAKAFERARSHANTRALTVSSFGEPGMIAGTPAYMSPEQARALPVDKRTDIWAFGCVLYEMLTGRSAFAGDHTSDIIAKVIEREVDLDALPPATPPAVRRLLERCLEKDPRRRLRDIGDGRFDLEVDVSAPTFEMPATRKRWALIGLATCVVTGLATAALLIYLRPAPPAAPISFTVEAPPEHVFEDTPVPSPAGDRLAFVARSAAGESALWLRSLDSPVPRHIPGTEDAIRVFWSPDGRSLGFMTTMHLKRVDPEGGPVQVIATAAPPVTGATWNGDGTIVFAPTNRAPLHRVAAGGGAPEPVTALDAARGENSHRWPHFLPDGRHFLFTARAALAEHTGIYVGSLDSPAVTWLLQAQSPAIYLSTGHLLFVREGVLLAQRFDPSTLTLSGDARAIAGEVSHDTAGALAAFAASADGSVLVWAPPRSRQLTWFDRSGKEVGIAGPGLAMQQLRLAPNGARAAVVMADRSTGNRDIWVVELASGALARITSHPTNDWFPVWSPDGAQLVFASDRSKTPNFYRTAADGTGADESLPPFGVDFDRSITEAYPTDWSLDGSRLAFHSFPQRPTRSGGIWLLPMTGEPTPLPIVQGPFTEWFASFSPDGRWLAFVSDESGTDEVYVRSVDSAARFRISVGGGSQPRWRRDGQELFFVSPDNQLMSAALSFPNELTHAPPQALFTGCGFRAGSIEYQYDVAADGNRTLWSCPVRGSETTATVAIRSPALFAGQ